MAMRIVLMFISIKKLCTHELFTFSHTNRHGQSRAAGKANAVWISWVPWVILERPRVINRGQIMAWGPGEGRGKTLVAVIKSKLPQGN